MKKNKKERRERVLERLIAQEKSGVKTVKKSVTEKTPITDYDFNRIKNEKEKLKVLLKIN